MSERRDTEVTLSAQAVRACCRPGFQAGSPRRLKRWSLADAMLTPPVRHSGCAGATWSRLVDDRTRHWPVHHSQFICEDTGCQGGAVVPAPAHHHHTAHTVKPSRSEPLQPACVTIRSFMPFQECLASRQQSAGTAYNTSHQNMQEAQQYRSVSVAAR